MHSQPQDFFPEEDFQRPVESIMRCDDFKSNFARKLSNRYISRSQVSGSRQDVLKLCPDKQETLKKVPERIEQCTQLLKNINFEQNGENVKPPDKTIKIYPDIRQTGMNALKMEVDTLRWQLEQTEANRQMHIALLKQIVTFLNRVKEHIDMESQKNEPESDMNESALFLSQRSFNDLPRSQSVQHVSKNLNYSLSSTNKICTKKISKSICNIKGYKDCSSFWNKSKLTSVSETGEKISEEMSRLIALANTVLSTKVPDLACARVCNRNDPVFQYTKDEKKEASHVQNGTCKFDLKSATDNVVLNLNCDSRADNDITKKFGDIKNGILDDFIVSQSALSFDLENDASGVKLFEQEQQGTKNGLVTSCGKVHVVDKRIAYNASSNFIEDESGFSSMSSLQEIGIPIIISVIPPSPCKEIKYLNNNIVDETEKWNTDPIELDFNTIEPKVFWV